jgi:hypothetical protein
MIIAFGALSLSIPHNIQIGRNVHFVAYEKNLTSIPFSVRPRHFPAGGFSLHVRFLHLDYVCAIGPLWSILQNQEIRIPPK